MSTIAADTTSIAHLIAYLKLPTTDEASVPRKITEVTKAEIIQHVCKVTKHWLPRWRRRIIKFFEGITVKYDWRVILPAGKIDALNLFNKMKPSNKSESSKLLPTMLMTTISHKHFADIFNFFVVIGDEIHRKTFPVVESADYLDKFSQAHDELGFSSLVDEDKLLKKLGRRKFKRIDAASSKMIPKNLWYSVIMDIYKLLGGEMSSEMLRIIENDISFVCSTVEENETTINTTNAISAIINGGNWIYCPRQHYNAGLIAKPNQTAFVCPNVRNVGSSNISWYPHRMDKSQERLGYVEKLIPHGKLTWHDYQIGGLHNFYKQQTRRIIDIQFRFCREKIEPADNFLTEYSLFVGDHLSPETFLTSPLDKAGKLTLISNILSPLINKMETLKTLAQEDCQDLRNLIQLLTIEVIDTTTTTLTCEDDISDISDTRKIRGTLAKSIFVRIPIAYEDLLQQVHSCCRGLNFPRALSDIVSHYLPVNLDSTK